MNNLIRLLFISAAMAFSHQASAYSGELWLSQAKQEFGTPANMLAHGFIAGVVHSWNNRHETKSPNLCFDAPPEQRQIKTLVSVVLDYIDDREPDLQAPAQSIIRVAMMGRFPCRS